MKRYVKNGIEVKIPTRIINNKEFPLFSNKLMEKLGYKIKNVDNNEVIQEREKVIDNNIIKQQREIAYKTHSDKYFIAYQAYKELGETEKALEMKKLWLKERNNINRLYPYINETDVEQNKTE